MTARQARITGRNCDQATERTAEPARTAPRTATAIIGFGGRGLLRDRETHARVNQSDVFIPQSWRRSGTAKPGLSVTDVLRHIRYRCPET